WCEARWRAASEGSSVVESIRRSPNGTALHPVSVRAASGPGLGARTGAVVVVVQLPVDGVIADGDEHGVVLHVVVPERRAFRGGDELEGEAEQVEGPVLVAGAGLGRGVARALVRVQARDGQGVDARGVIEGARVLWGATNGFFRIGRRRGM